MRTALPVTQRERPLPAGLLLVSTGDLDTRITYCNAALVEASGYGPPELIGMRCEVMCHPDVPSELFRQLWRTVLAGRRWSGVLEHRCKNGDHFWMAADIAPLVEEGRTTGYMLTELPATPDQVARAERLYARLRLPQGRLWQRLQALRRPDGHPATGLVAGVLAAAIGVLLGLGWDTALPPVDGDGPSRLPPPALAGALMLVVAAAVVAGWLMALALAAAGPAWRARRLRQRLARMARQAEPLPPPRLPATVGAAAAAAATAANAAAAGAKAATATAAEPIAGHAPAMAPVPAAEAVEAAEPHPHNPPSPTPITPRMAEVAALVDSLAFQSHVLALSAEVEASRAGSHGQGFGRVAGEVGTLARRCAEAARELRSALEA